MRKKVAYLLLPVMFALTISCSTGATTGYPPDLSAVGPRIPLAAAAGGNLPAGDYSGTKFTSLVSLSSKSGAYTFADCEFVAGIATVFGGNSVTRTVEMSYCSVDVGLYFEDGGQEGWKISNCHLVGENQGLRPKGLTISDFKTPTPFSVLDSIVEITGLGTPAAHCEAMQCLGGNSMTFTRVRFIVQGPYTNGVTGQTASINHGGDDTTFTNCEFLEANAFYYTVYGNGRNVVFKNCKFAKGMAGYYYPNSETMASYIGCTDIDTGVSVKMSSQARRALTLAFTIALATALGAPAQGAGYVGPPDRGRVGPRVEAIAHAGGRLQPGSYQGAKFASPVTLAAPVGSYTFIDCYFPAGFAPVFGGASVNRTVLIDHCAIEAGLYFEDGGQKGWTIRWSYLSGKYQALRPKGLSLGDTTSMTPFVVEDSICEITERGTPAAHCEAMQSLGGNGFRFSRVRFITPGPYENGVTGQTASINHCAGATLFDECEFLSPRAFHYTIYSNGDDVVFRRCRVAKGLSGYLFPPVGPAPRFEDCVDRDSGAPIQ